MERGPINPGDAVNLSSLPRYQVLAGFKIMEELGLIEVIYSKGSHKVYKISNKGETILKLIKEGKQFDLIIKEGEEEKD